MKMEELQNELDETRSALSKLADEHSAKTLLSESLRSANAEQLARLQDAKAEIVKQAREIDAKAEEILTAKQMYEDLRSGFSQKELVVKQLRAANESMKNSFKEEAASWEVMNRELVSALDEANAERGQQKHMISGYQEEIVRLKGLLMVAEKKWSDVENHTRALKEPSRRDAMLFELEDEKARVEEKLKWKSEQFRHLEDAHRKFQVEYRASTKEWESERSNLFNEINRLQMDLDSWTRVADELRSQLLMCNQALAHEESRRKLLEITASESKSLYENVVMEYEEARSKIEGLTGRRDEDIASLRNSLATKAALLKEAEYGRTHLEIENQELKKSLKEFEEARINEGEAAASLKNLGLKFRSLEQTHRDCSENLKTKEVEWAGLTEKLRDKLDECLAKLVSKDKQIIELQIELEGTCGSLMQRKLESEVILTVHLEMESKLLELCANLEKSNIELEQYCANIKERFNILMEQMEKKNNALVQANADTKRDLSTIRSLEERIVYLVSFEQEHILIQNELASYKRMFEESSRNFERSRQQGLNDLQEELKRALAALDQANSALAEKTSEVCSFEFELQQLRTAVERTANLRTALETELAEYRAENEDLRRSMEAAFLARTEAEKNLAEEKDRVTEELQRQRAMLENDFSTRESKAATLAKLVVAKETKRFEIAKELEKKIHGVFTKLGYLEQKYDGIVAGVLINLEHHEATVFSLEREYTSLLETAISSRLAEKQFETDAVYEIIERISAVHIIAEHEIQFKTALSDEMEEEIKMLRQSLFAEANRSFGLKDQLSRLEAGKLMEKLERDREKVECENELRSMTNSNRALEGRIVQLTLEREESIELMREICDLIGEVYQKDESLMKNWARVAEKAKNEDEAAMHCEGENITRYSKIAEANSVSLSRNTAGQNADRRLPLRECNS